MMSSSKKRIRLSELRPEYGPVSDPFDTLPDDLVISVLSKLCSSSCSPSDFINSLSVCKRFNRLGLNPVVLSRASSGVFSIRAKNWSDSAHRFVKYCADAGSVEACYFLGMIRFYCLEKRGSGASLMAKAAIRCHAPSLYSLAIIHFNGSGGTKTEKDLRAGAELCTRAAYYGHVEALRELGYCLQDGYGFPRRAAEGHRLLIRANRLEWVLGLEPVFDKKKCHPVNRFLLDWFGLRGGLSDTGLGMCSYNGCGRPETRSCEFRSCSVCGVAKYCSRGCQAHDWRVSHKAHCTPPTDGGNVAEHVEAMS